jgi:hypothetical protein
MLILLCVLQRKEQSMDREQWKIIVSAVRCAARRVQLTHRPKRRIPLWCLTPLNAGEVPIARLLVQQTQQLCEGSLTLADGNYDAYNLHKELDQRGGRLLVALKQDPGYQSRHRDSPRQMGRSRRELIALHHEHPELIRMVYRQRTNAEGIFGNLCSYGGGPAGLPPWVRRLPRVRRWVGGKLILYHARLLHRRRKKEV